MVASSRPSTLDPSAVATLRFAPGATEAALGALAAALGSPRSEGKDLGGLAGAARTTADAVRAAASGLAGDGPVVVLWGERVAHGERGTQAVEALLALAGSLSVSGTEDSGLIEVPAGANGRGLREVGCLPNLASGARDASRRRAWAPRRSSGRSGEDVRALLLVHVDPDRELSDRSAWTGRASTRGAPP